MTLKVLRVCECARECVRGLVLPDISMYLLKFSEVFKVFSSDVVLSDLILISIGDLKLTGCVVLSCTSNANTVVLHR